MPSIHGPTVLGSRRLQRSRSMILPIAKLRSASTGKVKVERHMRLNIRDRQHGRSCQNPEHESRY